MPSSSRRAIDWSRIPEADPDVVASVTELADRAPEPAVAPKVLFGSAGWTDPTLVKSGTFYPRVSQSPQERLEFYARYFRLVEVDATYYSLLTAETASRWVEWTPEDFRFDVKAFPILTQHPIEIARLPADLKAVLEAAGFERRVYPDKVPNEVRQEIELRFRLMLEPLHESGKLASVFLQFPPWFTATRRNALHIENVAERWHGMPLSVEFRHASWLAEDRRESVLSLLRSSGLTYICVDEPHGENSGVPPVLAVTNPRLAVLRFHGKNASGWQKKGATVHERFNYLYSPDELGAWVQGVQRLAGEAERVHAVFNNCVRNYAVLNARALASLLLGA
ncbi:MAG TPA: DUF72 domain-containing protein [Polyangiaceae bacterium]|nr:DUF72 domain-containing protein [Polyangiaceae bacterium]